VSTEKKSQAITLGLGMKELPPRGTRASRRGIDSPTLQDRPDAGRREHDIHGGKLTMDPPIAPGRVLTSQPDDEGGGACSDCRSTGPAVWVRPASLHEVSVPARQGGWLNKEPSATDPR
jgi:hypothetical protein